jgi:hypothetical protein
MRPAFSDALYYPTIDIENTQWLKTALLFWDSISTIVPESIDKPYKIHDTKYLNDIGFLRPLRVNSTDKSVVGIEEDILELMFSREFYKTIATPNPSIIFGEKMSYRVREMIHENMDYIQNHGIYPEKMSHQVQSKLRQVNHDFMCDDMFLFENKFAYLYMITLANKLSEDHTLGLVTDTAPNFDIGNTLKTGNYTTILPDHIQNKNNHNFKQGLLLDFIINGISISRDNNLKDIVLFKERRRDELGRFLTELSRLTQNINTEQPLDYIRNEINNLHKNEYLPAFNDFKSALKDDNIKWFNDAFLKISLLYASTTSISMALLGMNIPQALFAGAGVSAISQTISYNIEKKKQLRKNPYSYLLSVERNLS